MSERVARTCSVGPRPLPALGTLISARIHGHGKGGAKAPPFPPRINKRASEGKENK